MVGFTFKIKVYALPPALATLMHIRSAFSRGLTYIKSGPPCVLIISSLEFAWLDWIQGVYAGPGTVYSFKQQI